MNHCKRLLLLAGAVAASSCVGAAELKKGNGEQMQAIVQTEYGTTDVLRLESVDRPAPVGKQVLVKVRAAAVNPIDWHFMTGKPYLVRFMSGWGAPKAPYVGRDLAGEVVAVGPEVTRFKVGDAVFGLGPSAFAEYSLAAERRLASKPAGISYEQAAAMPVAAVTALQGLRDYGQVQAGQKILINGASGGVGTYMVQLAKVMGAEVTAVCSSRNVELVRSLGADHVIDYTQEDFTRRPERYDVILDNVGNRSFGELRSVLTPTGTLVGIGGGTAKDANWGFSLLGKAAHKMMVRPFTDQRFVGFMAEVLAPDLEYVAALMEQGKVRSVIDRRYPLAEAAEALRYIETGRARGKVIIEVSATAGLDPGTELARASIWPTEINIEWE
jgi:NADPH:quinone reductase-like Zn-dependent oxidoreductase